METAKAQGLEMKEIKRLLFYPSSIFNPVLEWFKEKEKILCISVGQWMINFVLKKCPELFNAYVLEMATELSIKLTMKILDRERIVHCFQCPQRFGLTKVGNHYYCLNHTQGVEANQPN